MAEHSLQPLYYAKGVEVFKSPVHTKAGGKTNITMGFSVCIVSDFVEAKDVASMLIAAEGHEALVKALRTIAGGTFDEAPPFRGMPREEMQRIATAALSLSGADRGGVS